jgi:hypothetical protein
MRFEKPALGHVGVSDYADFQYREQAVEFVDSHLNPSIVYTHRPI